MALTTTKGRGSTFKFMVMTDLTKDAQGNYKRPGTFGAAALTLGEVTTSDVNISHAERVTSEPSVMYASPAPGTGEEWKDAEPGEGSWSFSITGNYQPAEADRAAYDALRTAQVQRKIVWVERQVIGETVFEGGAAYISGGTLPVPGDATVTFTASFAGKGKFHNDTSTATSAA